MFRKLRGLGPQYIMPVVAGAGAALCIAFATGSLDALCTTSGCNIYHSYSFAGLSFCVWGALAFALVLAVSLFARDRWTRRVCAVFLAADTGFLLYMAIFWPCASCLAVAAFIGLLFYSANRPLRKASAALLLCWMVFFGLNLLSAGLEHIEPWTLSRASQADTRVYFSPTCDSCREVVQSVLDKREGLEDVAFVPLAKSELDIAAIRALERKLDQGSSIASALRSCCRKDFRARKAAGQSWFDSLCLRAKLWTNKCVLSSKGWATVPVIEAKDSMFVARAEKGGKSVPNGCSLGGGSTCGESAAQAASGDGISVGFK